LIKNGHSATNATNINSNFFIAVILCGFAKSLALMLTHDKSAEDAGASEQTPTISNKGHVDKSA
jgi:hypothetical protein